MSLLMEALQKAEQEKKRAAELTQVSLHDPLSITIKEENSPLMRDRQPAPGSGDRTNIRIDDPELEDDFFQDKTIELTLESITQHLTNRTQAIFELEPPMADETRERLERLAHTATEILPQINNDNRDPFAEQPTMPLPPPGEEPTMPSARAIQSSFQDYHVDPAANNPTMRVDNQYQYSKPYISDSGATRVTANTVFVAGPSQLKSQSLRLGAMALAGIALTLGLVWIAFYLITPERHDLPSMPASLVEKSATPSTPTATPPSVTGVVNPSGPGSEANPVTPPPTEGQTAANQPVSTATPTTPMAETSSPAPALETTTTATSAPTAEITPPAAATKTLTSATNPAELATNTTATENTASPYSVTTARPHKAVPAHRYTNNYSVPAYRRSPKSRRERYATTAPTAVSPITPALPAGTGAGPGAAMAMTAPSAIQISKGDGTPETSTFEVRDAYLAYNHGDYYHAENVYRRVLDRYPEQRDAMLGLAAIALRKGNKGEAERHYQHLLSLNPRDSVAAAALTNLNKTSASPGSESQIKMMLDHEPRSSHLHFSLGNLYARQNRWAEAQEAYFKAHSSDARNPDYMFNLAVSLDRLGQRKAALQFYQQALEHADRRPVNFDTARVMNRINALSHNTDNTH